MHRLQNTTQLRSYASAAFLYGLTIGFTWFVLNPPIAQAAPVVQQQSNVRPIFTPQKLDLVLVNGRPTRIVIPSRGIDLPITPGYYDESTASWTLHGNNVHFAMMSSQANNVSGNTLLYGHNNNAVFGALRHAAPTHGAEAFVHTDNGHVFVYSFTAASSVSPYDTTVLQYQGPSRLTVLTCTGSMDEWRTLYQFNFVRVAQS